MALPNYTLSGRRFSFSYVTELIDLARKNGIDGWDADLLWIIEEQLKLIKDLNSRVETLEESQKYAGERKP